ncbi:hypothetical protein [Embleya sp. NPDC001921]
MTDDDIETGRPVLTYCSALRITPYGWRSPDHTRAVAYRLTEPATVTDTRRHRRLRWVDQPPEGARITPIPVHVPVPRVLALTAPYGHPQARRLAAIAYRFHERAELAAIETWTETPIAGTWLYQLYPRVEPTDPRQVRPPVGVAVLLAGHAHGAHDTYRWPGPFPNQTVRIGDEVTQAIVLGPPPGSPSNRPAERNST